MEDTGKKKNSQNGVLMYLHDLFYVLAAFLFIFVFIFRVSVVTGPSMMMTLLDGDYLLLLGKPFYGTPEQGDIIVAAKDSFDNGKPIIKRVIATEGQIVDIDFEKGIVYVDGVALEEPYTNTPTTMWEGMEFPIRVQEGKCFVLGDNRNSSKDSRNLEIGLIDYREILGKALFLFLPGREKPLGKIDFSRIGVVS